VITDEPTAVPVVSAKSYMPSTMPTTSNTVSAAVGAPSMTQSTSAVGTGAVTVSSSPTTTGTSTVSTTATTTSSTTLSSSTTTTTTSSTTAPVIVVRQLQAVRPYNGTTSWKSFRDHFNRVTKVNSWTTNDELIQHLTLSLEGAAAEILRDFVTAFTDLWAKLQHRFGEVDSDREAMQKFDARRQSDSESLVEFEQAQYLRLHHCNMNFTQTRRRGQLLWPRSVTHH